MGVRSVNRTSVSFDINRGNWGNRHIFPDVVYADTNSVVDIFAQRTHGQLVEDYLKRLIQNDGMIIWSQHTMNEITDFVHYNQYIQLADQKNIIGNKRMKIAEDTATDIESREIAEKVIMQTDSIKGYLEQFGTQVEQDEQKVIELARRLYGSHGNSMKDCRHVASANLEGVNSILTQDVGFLRFPNLNVYGASYKLKQGYKTSNTPAPYIDLSTLGNSEDEKEQDTA